MKYLIIILVVLIIGIGIWYYKSNNNDVPSLEGYDNISKIATYKYKGKKQQINLKNQKLQMGPYSIEGILLDVNVADIPIGTIIGVALKKNGVIIDQLRS